MTKPVMTFIQLIIFFKYFKSCFIKNDISYLTIKSDFKYVGNFKTSEHHLC